jgi:CHAD domain-containing protein
MENRIYRVNPEVFNLDSIISLLSKEFSEILKDESELHEKEYFDSFDTRLLKNNISLCGCNNSYTLKLADKTTKTFLLKRKPIFLGDFPEEINNLIASILDIRALLSVTKLQCENTKITFLNADKKTVLRGLFEKTSLNSDGSSEDLSYFLTLLPLRGYEKRLSKVENILLENASCKCINSSDLLKDLYLKSKNVNINYVEKPIFNLTPRMNSYDAVRNILRTLLEVIKANENGIINDSDSEFLHDYRVAIRKSRSIFEQVSKVFNSDLLKKHKINLKEIVSTTNSLRDMDVYLLSEDEYRGMLPEHLHQELDVFFKDVAKKKRKEHRIVSKMLQSAGYLEKIKDWESFLVSKNEKQKGAEAEKKAVNLAKRYIYKRYHKIVKQGKVVKKTSPDDDFHRVRISCKKLRYLMELFSSLFPKDEISAATKQLKNIQDSLGNFNDMCMQQIHLDKYLHALSGRKTDNAKIAAAIGGLITSTYNRKYDYRIEFYQKFNNFISSENNKIFEKLFKC